MIRFFLIMGSIALSGAFGTHAIQEQQRVRRERRDLALAAAEANAQRHEKDADRRRAEQDAEQGRQRAKEEAETKASRDRHRRRPRWLVTITRSKIRLEQEPFRHALNRLHARRTEVQDELLANTRTAPLAAQVVCVLALAFLPVAFAVSAAQLIPSFHALSTAPIIIDALLGSLLAAVEICVAVLLAHHLRPAQGWRTLGSKLSAATAICFAGCLIVMQLAWAPAHDVLPLRHQLATAKENYQLDAVSSKDPTLLAADQQAISAIESRLSEVTERDQGLALVVTLGADIAAWPALTGADYVIAAGRRRRIRRDTNVLDNEIATVQEQYDAVAVRHTLLLQQELDQLGVDPAVAIADVAPTDASSADDRHDQPSLHDAGPDRNPVSTTPATPNSANDDGQPVRDDASVNEVDSDSLFTPKPAFSPTSTNENHDLGRWTDPF